MTEAFLADGDEDWAFRDYELADCPDCLVGLWFPRGSSTGTHSRAPMEEVGLSYVRLSNSTLAKVMTFKPHDCAKTGRVDPTTGQVVLTRREVWEQSMQIALTKVCPKCNALPGDGCTDMRKGKFNGQPTNWPHPDRIGTDR